MTNIVQKTIKSGGRLVPIIIPNKEHPGSGLMNPSVFINNKNEILVNLRHINYTLYHSENSQKFPSTWGPLAYLHPENDMALRTINYICKLDENLSIINYGMVDTSKFDIDPVWEFTGEEDCRLVQWNNRYYIIGVRRDTKPNGEGRMELSEIEIDESFNVSEISRIRIPAPGDDKSYCEKNWMPILDKPYHFVKWTSPTEVVVANHNEPGCEQVSISGGVQPPLDQRGGSQVIPWGDKYIAITHEVNLFKNYLDQKDGIYRHRLMVWNSEFNLIGYSNAFSFLDARVEFCTGIAKYGEDVLISFGFQDNAAFILKTPKIIIENLIKEATND